MNNAEERKVFRLHEREREREREREPIYNTFRYF